MAVTKQQVDEVMLEYFALQNQISGFEKEEDRANFINEHMEVFEKASKFIKHQIDCGNFQMHYQPQVKDGKTWASAEALFRMSYDGKRLYPDVVFSLAKRFGYERDLTLSLYEKVCKQTSVIKQEMGEDFYVSYNVNPKLIDRDFCKQLYQIAGNNNLSPSSIGVELLEVSSFDNVKLEDIELLKKCGFKILLDDFGAGYATEDVIKQIPFDVVKLSEKLVSNVNLPENGENKRRIEEVLNYCRENNLGSVAEHVETKEEYETLSTLGVEKVQGWYFSKDLPFETFLEKCNSNSRNI